MSSKISTVKPAEECSEAVRKYLLGEEGMFPYSIIVACSLQPAGSLRPLIV
jgi:hypothetical protein